MGLANSKEKCYALTRMGSLHSVEIAEPLANQVCFMTSQPSSIGEIVFPTEYSEVFAIRSLDQIRVWNVADQKELLRICLEDTLGKRPLCNCLQFSHDGRSIISGWSDGSIRFFTPQTGRLLFVLKEAHKMTTDNIT